MNHISVLIALPVAIVFSYVTAFTANAGNIDPSLDGHRYGYGENVGWLNLAPSQGPGVSVGDYRLTGYIWSENLGWINLNPTFGGVIQDGAGHLSGYAWSENAGWINFSCTTGNTCSTVDFGVNIDTETGLFSGQAWGENIGWVTFNLAGFPENHVLTDWRINGDISSDGAVTLDDAILMLQVMAGITPAVPVHSGADINGDNRVGLEETVYILKDISSRQQIE